MDFGDFITFILFLVFIGAPLLNRKKAQKPGKSKQSGFSVLGKISEALREAAREMNAQAERARTKEMSRQNKRPFDQAGEKSVNQTFWDEIDDRKEFDFYPEEPDAQVIGKIEPVNEKILLGSTKKELRKKAAKIPETRDSKPIRHDTMQTSCPGAGPRRLPARARGLRKAVIWSEILGKPVALRD